MKTPISKLIFIMLPILIAWSSYCASYMTSGIPDVRAYFTLPSSPENNDGIIDLIINTGKSPYNIKYLKDNGSGIFTTVYEVNAVNNGDEDYLAASVGIYRVEIADAQCAFLSLDIIVSFECNCQFPVLYYNTDECFLHWTATCEQTGYSYFLEFFSGNTWGVLQTQNAQHPIQTNGKYRIRLSRPGCTTQYSDVISTSCSLPVQCRCTVHTLVYNAPDCVLSWSNPSCQGFTPSLQFKNTSNIWENISNVSSPHILVKNGNYRLMFSKTDCLPSFSNLVNVSCVQTNTVSQGSLIINEFSQGCQGMEEYIEFIVTGSTPFVTVEGMIIDDNNHITFEQGNESGHIRLGSCFNYVPVGSIIVIYNEANINPNINSNHNGSPGSTGVYQMSVNDPCILQYPSCPDNHSGRTDYNCGTGPSGGWRDLIPLYNLRDVVQVRNNNGSLVEAVVYGGAMFNGTGGSVINIPNSSNLTMFRRVNHTTWTASDPCGNTRPTPGFANDLLNDEFIKEIRKTEGSSLYLLPNPAHNTIDVISTKDIESIEILDLTGKLVYTHINNNDKASNINIDHLSEGIHLVKVKYTDQSIEFKKFLKINQ